MEQLVVCGVCHRHVKHREAECPFCNSAMPAVCRTVGLAGVVAVGVTLSLAACSSTITGSGGGGAAASSTTPSGGGGGSVIPDGGFGGALADYAPPPPPFGD